MHSFKAAYINELYKISKKKKLNAAVILSLALIAIGAIAARSVKNFMGINITGNSEFSLIMLPLFVNIVIPLFTIFICIDMFCGEYNANTMKTVLLSPASRVKIFGAKICAAMTFIFSMLMFVMIVSFTVSIILRSTQFDFIKIFVSYLISLFPLGVICLMASLIANAVKGSGGSFMVCVIALLLFKALEIMNPSISSLFFTSSMNMYILVNAPLIAISKIFRLILISIGYSVMFFAAGYALFENKEI